MVLLETRENLLEDLDDDKDIGLIRADAVRLVDGRHDILSAKDGQQ